MQRSSVYVIGVVVAITAGFILSANQLTAQSMNFSSVTAFSTKDGQLAFFDQLTGKLYIYDNEGKKCLLEAQLKELGKPFESIRKTSAAAERKMSPGAKVMVNGKGEKTVVLEDVPSGN